MSGPPRQTSLFASLRRKRNNRQAAYLALLIGLSTLFSFSCQQLKTANTDSFYAEPVPPRKQEFRWSNGKAPKSIDPALASAPPETDIIRAIYEGLTDLDPKALREIPAVAEKWTASADSRIWTFQLRKDAKWTNGDRVTATDFVRSWKRLAELGEKTANRNLLDNIAGARTKQETPVASPTPGGAVKEPPATHEPTSQFSASKRPQINGTETTSENRRNNERPETSDNTVNHKTGAEQERFGVEAVSDLELKVSLISPDKDFPKLVANPIFRPVFGDGKYFEEGGLVADAVTNGPFRISSVGADGIVVTRSDKYWNRAAITLESVRFVPQQSAEKALDAYRSGDVDAVTNADFEPLALKLLSPYSDFRQATHNALNFFEINATHVPFTDRRVREALAISIERNKLAESEMKGSTEPAFHFLPYDANVNDKVSQDFDRARELLESAGFPNGDGFPVIHLAVNRNDTQLRIARSVMRMWKQNLNLNAELVVKETSEMDAVRTSGDFDIIRRGVVFPTVDKKASFAALFPDERKADAEPERRPGPEIKQSPAPSQPGPRAPGPSDLENPQSAGPDFPNETASETADDAALFDFRLIPLYFPMSYGLVKPYVQGFDLNGLDAPSLKDVRIDSDWQPKTSN
jgi:ABC-type oligopeptide transport system substrate-binding subunit